ncbi:MAG: rane protein of unknown function, partial [Candidatus Saccharibacteria bacterium]|nr:rane protein of unknown function [Candidatus Saccharibacteria bacterium]
YSYIDPQQKAHVISFPSGADLATVTAAQYSEYSFVPPGTYNNKTNARQISIDAQSSTNQGVNSCDNTFTFGIGWIICPATNFLAGAMDWLFQILSGFLAVRPAQTNAENALYRAWSYMRNFANIAFVIAFLIIIYSQLTSFGISNYGIKKILPRLIIAAILVNASYWICAIAIDISNILGYSLQSLFIGMRNAIIGAEGNSWDVVSWQSLGGFILSGGTAAVAIGVGGHALAAGAAGGALFLLLPILVGALMAVLVALLIMAARQAIITVLVILAPLAFVAYLLPNTEKYFDKWRGLFTTMLVLFPVFSVLFGGAQLAGIAIIQNADSINLIILGMAVQVAPVVITPFLIKFSGSLLGRIAGMVNNPNRGAIDRTRKWATERAAQNKDRALAQKDPNFAARLAQGIDKKRRIREGKQGGHKAMADARWARSQEYSNIQQTSFEAGQLKDIGETNAQARYEASKQTNPWIQSTDIQAREAKLEQDNASKTAERNWQNLQAGNTSGLIADSDVARSGLALRVRQNTERSQVLASNLQAAQHVQQQNFAEELEKDAGLREMAGGIDPSGALKAEARAMSVISKANKEDIEASVQLLNYKAIKQNTTLKELSASMLKEAAAGTAHYEPTELEAAVEAQAIEGAIPNLEIARGSTHIDQSMVTRVFARNAGNLKQKGGFHLQANPKLNVADLGPAGFEVAMDKGRIGSLGDTTAANIKDIKFGQIQSLADKIQRNNVTKIIDHADEKDLQKAYDNAFQALHNPEVFATIGDRRKEVQAIEFALRSRFNTSGGPPNNGATAPPVL